MSSQRRRKLEVVGHDVHAPAAAAVQQKVVDGGADVILKTSLRPSDYRGRSQPKRRINDSRIGQAWRLWTAVAFARYCELWKKLVRHGKGTSLALGASGFLVTSETCQEIADSYRHAL